MDVGVAEDPVDRRGRHRHRAETREQDLAAEPGAVVVGVHGHRDVRPLCVPAAEQPVTEEVADELGKDAGVDVLPCARAPARSRCGEPGQFLLRQAAASVERIDALVERGQHQRRGLGREEAAHVDPARGRGETEELRLPGGGDRLVAARGIRGERRARDDASHLGDRGTGPRCRERPRLETFALHRVVGVGQRLERAGDAGRDLVDDGLADGSGEPGLARGRKLPLQLLAGPDHGAGLAGRQPGAYLEPSADRREPLRSHGGVVAHLCCCRDGQSLGTRCDPLERHGRAQQLLGGQRLEPAAADEVRDMAQSVLEPVHLARQRERWREVVNRTHVGILPTTSDSGKPETR